MNVAWFVSANDQVFGPYPHELMRDYVSQKRIGQRSLVRLGETGEFMPAGMHAALARCFEVEDVTSSSTDAKTGTDTKSDREVRTARTRSSDADNTKVSNFAVIADFRSGSMLKFEGEIKKLGRVFRVNPNVWLLQCEQTSNAIKQALAPHVGAADPLLIIDAARNSLAWHNFDAFQAAHVRDLWKLPHERG